MYIVPSKNLKFEQLTQNITQTVETTLTIALHWTPPYERREKGR
jgi:hypothetical protein